MSRAACVYVHGLWMPGVEARLLGRRLARAHQYDWYSLRYHSVRQSMAQVTAALQALLERIEAPRLHLVGHSLGGVVILRYLESYRPRAPGRVVLLGSPVAGSSVARRVAGWRWGRALLGRLIAEELLIERERRWHSERELGIIAGTRPLGMGRVLMKFREPSDGTVALSETRLAGAKAHRELPVSHMGLLASARVARETGYFLEHGRFGL